MNDFTASNGVRVRIEHLANGADVLDVSKGGLKEEIVGLPRVQALREFFQVEADERLGRWRWPENPDYVVYPDGEMVCITNERTGHGNVFGRQWYEDHKTGLLSKEQPGVYAAAGAYFDAHPEPKPWHDAKPGEVWVLETRSDLGVDKRAWHITDRPESFWALTQGYLLVRSKSIISGYRIWPEVSS